MQKQSQNKIVVLEGFQNTVTKEMIYNYFKKAGVKFITINTKKLNAFVEFETDKFAKEAVDNFYGKPLLKKPLIMAFKSDKAGSVTEFHVSGFETASADLNSINRITSKYGKSSKLRFNLSNSNKVSNNGYLSYLSITPAEIENLTKDLENVGIKISTYDKEKKNKVTVRIENFVQPYKTDKNLFSEEISSHEKRFKELVSSFVGPNVKEYKVSITAKPNPQGENDWSAYITFDEQEKAVGFFDKIKAVKNEHFVPTAYVGIKVTDESESMSNIFSIGLVKPDQKMSDEAFENSIFKALKDECGFAGTINVTVKAIKKPAAPTSTAAPASTTAGATGPTVYLAFITMANEDSGKELLSVYREEKYKKILKKFYKGEPFFNIFISAKFKKEMLKAKEGFNKMSKEIKNFGDQLTKDQIEMKGMVNRGTRPYQYPVGGPMPGMAGIPGMPGMNPMAMMGNLMPRPGMPGMPMPGMPGMPGMNPIAVPFQMGAPLPVDRNDMLKEKDQYLTKDPVVVRRLIFPIIKSDIQQIVKDINQTVFLANKILSKSDIETLFTFIENKEELRKEIQAASFPIQNN